MAPVILELGRHSDRFATRVISTGQHREMLDSALALFEIQPHVELKVMRPNQSLAGLTASLLARLDAELERQPPDWILAQGDTTTVMVAAIVAFYRRIKFGHVEAGLRTGDFAHPFPEEFNRRVADVAADLYFAPTERARSVLLREGIESGRILVTGNTVVDALLTVAARPFDRRKGVLAGLRSAAPLVLVTAHRRESFGPPFRELCQAIRELSERFPDAEFLYPVHLNPNVRSPVQEILADLPGVHLTEPLDYLEIVHAMKSASLILTDSGGIQEEAPTFGVPVLVMRETTERPEGVDAGFVELVGTNRERIVEAAAKRLVANSPRPTGANPYGDGRAAARIVGALLESRKS